MKPLIAAIALLFTVVTPALAKPVTGYEPWFSVNEDTDNHLATFFNLTRADFCAWEDSGFDGDPNVTKDLAVQYNDTPTGATVVSVTDKSSMELWPLDAGEPTGDLCLDTEDASAPWATGSANFRFDDDDFDHFYSVFVLGLHRTDSFGEQGIATVKDASGKAWLYTWTYRRISDKSAQGRDAIPFQTSLHAK